MTLALFDPGPTDRAVPVLRITVPPGWAFAGEILFEVPLRDPDSIDWDYLYAQAETEWERRFEHTVEVWDAIDEPFLWEVLT